jgi:PLP dependent protein
MPADVDRIIGNLAGIRRRIADAAARDGRPGESVRLVAVTKYVGSAAARAVVAAGCHDLGESRPQALWSKASALSDLPVCWHMIGHLQRNKIARTMPLVGLIHSVDSPRLLDALEAAAAGFERVVDVLLEVNISGEESKSGYPPGELEAELSRAACLPHLRVRGFMGMAPLAGGLAAAQSAFAGLRALRDRLRRLAPPGVSLDELSMGMSGDFESAIEHGATIVRIGSALFEGMETGGN